MFNNETLDLSHEDIQQTLSANLGHEMTFHPSTSHAIGPHGLSGGDDDLLVNLDAFDMLTEFPDLDCHDAIDSLISIQQQQQPPPPPLSLPAPPPLPVKIASTNPAASVKDVGPAANPSGSLTLTDLTDFSPEWAPTEVRTSLRFFSIVGRSISLRGG